MRHAPHAVESWGAYHMDGLLGLVESSMKLAFQASGCPLLCEAAWRRVPRERWRGEDKSEWITSGRLRSATICMFFGETS
jgi:hypothetical protein